jgi:hypothetical protein
MPRQQTRLSDKDFKLLKKEGMGILGETGHLFPTFGNSIEDFVKFCVYDMNDTYLKSGISEDFESTEGDIRLKPGNDLRKVGFTRGNYKVKYFFYRRLAGADEVVLTKTVGNQSGIIHSGNPKLTGGEMGAFYVDEDGKVYEGEKPPTDGSEPSELDVKEYKFFIDEISSDRTEVRLATQAINSDKYKDEFNNLLYPGGVYTPVTGTSGDTLTSPVLDGRGKFKSEDGAGFEFDTKASTDLGFLKNYQGGILQVEKAFITGYTPIPNTNENSNWSLEDPIPVITIESNYPDGNVTTNTPVTFTSKRENGNVAPSQLSYYWDFGCGHQEVGGPEITHDYTIDGSMNVSVVINSPNFVDTVILDNPLSISYPPDDPELPPSPSPEPDRIIEHIPNGTVIHYYQNYWLIEGGKKRHIVSWSPDGKNNQDNDDPYNAEGEVDNYARSVFLSLLGMKGIDTSGMSGNTAAARTKRDKVTVNVDSRVKNQIPDGPAFRSDDLTALGPTWADESEPLVDYDPDGDDSGGDDSGGDDSGDDSGGDDSGTQETFYTLSVGVKYNTATGNGITLVGLSYTISNEGDPDHDIDAYIKIDGINVGRSYNESYLAGETVNIEIVDDSYPTDLYGFVGWLGSGTSYDNTRTQVMSEDVNLTAIIRIVP